MAKILLVLQVLVCGDQNFEIAGFGLGNQVAVPEGGPTQFIDGQDLVQPEMTSEGYWSALVEKDSHATRRLRDA